MTLVSDKTYNSLPHRIVVEMAAAASARTGRLEDKYSLTGPRGGQASLETDPQPVRESVPPGRPRDGPVCRQHRAIVQI